MLSAKDNEALARVGRGTRMGELMRRYWQPVAAVAQLDERPPLPVPCPPVAQRGQPACHRSFYQNGAFGPEAWACPNTRANRPRRALIGVMNDVGRPVLRHGHVQRGRTSSVRRCEAIAQPITRRLHASSTTARYRHPVPVGT